MGHGELIQKFLEKHAPEEEKDPLGTFQITCHGIQIWLLLRSIHGSRTLFEACPVLYFGLSPLEAPALSDWPETIVYVYATHFFISLSRLLMMNSGTPEEVECCWKVDNDRCEKIPPKARLGCHLAADHDARGADARRLICMWIIRTEDGSQSLCHASFRRDNLKRHIMAFHLGNQKYKCLICKRTYSRGDIL